MDSVGYPGVVSYRAVKIRKDLVPRHGTVPLAIRTSTVCVHAETVLGI